MNSTNKPKVISTFAGCGGSSLGYKWAGFEELLAIDWHKTAVATFRVNFPETPVWQKDIQKVQAGEILDFCKLAKGDLDLLDGSPPCQGFSTSGSRIITDPRNDLFRHFVRLINELQPKVFVMENVSGMVKGKMKGKFKEVMRVLKELDYNIKCKLMNTKYYNVPQSRERLIWIGVRKDLDKLPSFPVPNTKIIPVAKVFDDLKVNDLTGTDIKTQNLRARIHLLKQGQSANKLFEGNKYFNTVRLAWLKPSPTILKTKSLIHPTEDRYLSIAECKRISSFPDDFSFQGLFQAQWGQIGNAVMPKFMQAIASQIRDNILN